MVLANIWEGSAPFKTASNREKLLTISDLKSSLGNLHAKLSNAFAKLSYTFEENISQTVNELQYCITPLKLNSSTELHMAVHQHWQLTVKDENI